MASAQTESFGWLRTASGIFTMRRLHAGQASASDSEFLRTEAFGHPRNQTSHQKAGFRCGIRRLACGVLKISPALRRYSHRLVPAICHLKSVAQPDNASARSEPPVRCAQPISIANQRQVEGVKGEEPEKHAADIWRGFDGRQSHLFQKPVRALHQRRKMARAQALPAQASQAMPFPRAD